MVVRVRDKEGGYHDIEIPALEDDEATNADFVSHAKTAIMNLKASASKRAKRVLPDLVQADQIRLIANDEYLGEGADGSGNGPGDTFTAPEEPHAFLLLSVDSLASPVPDLTFRVLQAGAPPTVATMPPGLYAPNTRATIAVLGHAIGLALVQYEVTYRGRALFSNAQLQEKTLEEVLGSGDLTVKILEPVIPYTGGVPRKRLPTARTPHSSSTPRAKSRSSSTLTFRKPKPKPGPRKPPTRSSSTKRTSKSKSTTTTKSKPRPGTKKPTSRHGHKARTGKSKARRL